MRHRATKSSSRLVFNDSGVSRLLRMSKAAFFTEYVGDRASTLRVVKAGNVRERSRDLSMSVSPGSVENIRSLWSSAKMGLMTREK